MARSRPAAREDFSPEHDEKLTTMGTEFGMRWSGPADHGYKFRGRHEEGEPRGWKAGVARCLRDLACRRAEGASIGITTYVLDGFEFWYFGVPQNAAPNDWIPRESVRKRWDRLRLHILRSKGCFRSWIEWDPPTDLYWQGDMAEFDTIL